MKDFQPHANYDLDLHDEQDAPSETALRIGARLDAEMGCGESAPESALEEGQVHELPLTLRVEVPSLTNSPGCVPTPTTAPRRMRAVRVDAWAVTASANWTRTRRTPRKVSRTDKPADWALPF